MRIGNRLKAGIAAAIGTGLLVVTPTVSNAAQPGELEHLPGVRCRADVRSRRAAGVRRLRHPTGRRTFGTTGQQRRPRRRLVHKQPILVIVACAE